MDYLKRRNEQGALLRSKSRPPSPGLAPSSSAPRITTRPGHSPSNRRHLPPGGSPVTPGPAGLTPSPANFALPITTTRSSAASAFARIELHGRIGGLRIALLRRHRPAHRARPRPPRRHRLDRQKHLHPQSATRLDGCFCAASLLRLTSRPSAPHPAADRCGTCRRCIEACPTDALIAPRQMDASRCIAYLTIEKRGPIPEELRAPIGRQVFGCDICQDVCPGTRRRGRLPSCSHRSHPGGADQPGPRVAGESSPEEFNRQFQGSPIKRTKRSGLLRNVAIAMGNSGPRVLASAQVWADAVAEDPVLAEAAAWAMERLSAL